MRGIVLAFVKGIAMRNAGRRPIEAIKKIRFNGVCKMLNSLHDAAANFTRTVRSVGNSYRHFLFNASPFSPFKFIPTLQ